MRPGWPEQENHERMPDDFRVEGEGPMTSVFRVVPLTGAAETWVDDHVSTGGFHPEWPTLHVEHRYLASLIEGIETEGLTVGTRTIQAAGV